jgi:3-hydroxyacyl-CoA dehydrogenase
VRRRIEGAAYRASDIDVMWLNGFNFPRYRGGLMYWADTIGGPAEVYRQIAAWHQRYGERRTPVPLLRRLADTGTPLSRSKARAADIIAPALRIIHAPLLGFQRAVLRGKTIRWLAQRTVRPPRASARPHTGSRA